MMLKGKCLRSGFNWLSAARSSALSVDSPCFLSYNHPPASFATLILTAVLIGILGPGSAPDCALCVLWASVERVFRISGGKKERCWDLINASLPPAQSPLVPSPWRPAYSGSLNYEFGFSNVKGLHQCRPRIHGLCKISEVFCPSTTAISGRSPARSISLRGDKAVRVVRSPADPLRKFADLSHCP